MSTTVEPILEYVKRKLGEHKGHWPDIVEETKVNYSTMSKIHQGVATNPSINTLQPLLDFFQAVERGDIEIGPRIRKVAA